MRKLWELVALAALGCSGISQTDAKMSPAIHVSQDAAKKEIRNDVVEPLKNYVYARYETDALQIKRDDLPAIETKLEKALTAAALPAETMLKLKEGARSKELEAFFESQGLLFRSITFFGSSCPLNYELLKIDSKEEKEMTVFDIKQKYTKIRIVDKELITNSFTYIAQKKNLQTPGVGSAIWHGKNTIEYRVWQGEALAKNYFDGEKEKWDAMEAEAKDWKKIDGYYFGKKNKQPFQLFYDHMGTVLHHAAVRDIFKASKDEAEFKQKIMPIWEREADIRNVMLVIDDFEYAEITKDLSEEDARKLSGDAFGQRETRALLAQMYHGTPHQYLGDLFKSVALPPVKELAFRQMASLAVLNFFVLQITHNRDTYNNIDTTGYEPGQEGTVYAQFGNLSAEQIKKLTKDTFDGLYKGKSLKEYMLDRAKEMKKKYD